MSELQNSNLPADPVEAEVVLRIRSAQGDVSTAIQLLVGSLRLHKRMNVLYQQLETAVKSHALDGQFLNVQTALNEIDQFRAEILAKSKQSSNSQVASPEKEV